MPLDGALARAMDVVYALRRRGRPLYGYGDPVGSLTNTRSTATSGTSGTSGETSASPKGKATHMEELGDPFVVA